MSKKAILVGNGPSLVDYNQGEWIDSHDIVVRFKRCQKLLGKPFYGSKVDVLCGSWVIARAMKGIGRAGEYWFTTDTRTRWVSENDMLEMAVYFYPSRIFCNPGLDATWDKHYNHEKDAIGLAGHPHTSQGMKGLIYAATYLPPEVEEINLVGFDNLITGDRGWSLTRGPDWQFYPDHSWATERSLLKRVRRAFPNRTFNFMLPPKTFDGGLP